VAWPLRGLFRSVVLTDEAVAQRAARKAPLSNGSPAEHRREPVHVGAGLKQR
jgi:hypothetical protein